MRAKNKVVTGRCAIYAALAVVSLLETALNGPSATNAMDAFTIRSASASPIQIGTGGPIPNRGTGSLAHATSFDGSMNENCAENASPKNKKVSTVDPAAEETSGAFHHSRSGLCALLRELSWKGQTGHSSLCESP